MYVPPLALTKVSIGLVETVHSQNLPVIIEAGGRIDSFVAIQCSLPECLEVRQLDFLGEHVKVAFELVAVSN